LKTQRNQIFLFLQKSWVATKLGEAGAELGACVPLARALNRHCLYALYDKCVTSPGKVGDCKVSPRDKTATFDQRLSKTDFAKI